MKSDRNPGARKRNKDARKTGATRRDFLVSTAAGAGLLFVGKAMGQEAAPAPAPPAEAPAAPAAPPPPAPTPAVLPSGAKLADLNIAMVGLGAEGMVLMDALLRIPGIRFKAVCDIWPYSLKRGSGMLKKYGHQVNAYVDFDEMLAAEKDNIDAVVVATPDFVHHAHTIASLKAGKHVYCEKEMSNKLENARQMVLAARETGKLLQIGHQRRSNPRYIHAINVLAHENRLLGRVTEAYGQWNRGKSASEDFGWPKKYEIEPAVLEKYGYESMQHFRNWRWYKKYGGGPIVDLGSHQIDIFSWVFGVSPKTVMACGGIDFYKSHEWFDNVLATFEYENAEGISRAFYQVLTTTSYGGFYEAFMGENGTLVISEVPQKGNHLLREVNAPEWEPYVSRGLLDMPPKPPSSKQKLKNVVLDVRLSAELGSWPLPIQFNKPPHQAHLENFLDAIRLGTPLSCPGEIGFETAVAVLKVNDAVEAGTKLMYAPEEFKA
jgi:predicted dehydrogenase